MQQAEANLVWEPYPQKGYFVAHGSFAAYSTKSSRIATRHLGRLGAVQRLIDQDRRNILGTPRHGICRQSSKPRKDCREESEFLASTPGDSEVPLAAEFPER